MQLGHIFVGPAVEYWSLALKYGTRPVSNDSQDDCHTIFPFSGGLGGVLVLLRRKEGWNGCGPCATQPPANGYHPQHPNILLSLSHSYGVKRVLVCGFQANKC